MAKKEQGRVGDVPADLSDDDLLSLYGGRDPAPVAAPVPVRGVPEDAALLAMYGRRDDPKSDGGGNSGSPAADAVGAFAKGALDLPIVGPAIMGGIKRAGAGIRSLRTGESYDDALKGVENKLTQLSGDYPGTELAGNLYGGVASMGALGSTALGARGLGLVGSLGERTLAGGLSGALIGGGDAAVRTGEAKNALEGAALGGLIGGGIPLAGRGIGAGVNKLMGTATDPATVALAGKAAEFGIPIRAGQASTNPLVKKLDQMVSAIPGSGQRGLAAEQQGAWQKAVSNTFGEDTAHITPEVMGQAKTRIGRVFDSVAARTIIQADEPFVRQLQTALSDANRVLTPDQVRPLQGQIGDVLGKIGEGRTITGAVYQALTRKGAPLDRLMSSRDPNIAHYAGEIRDALDGALTRSATPELRAALTEARTQYKNMMTVAPLVVKGTPGEISPALLQGQVNRSYRDAAFRGAGDIGDLASIGQRFLKAPPDSGTPLGMMALNMLTSPVGIGAGLAGGAGGAAYYGADPLHVAGGVGGLLATGLLARGGTAALNNPAAVNRLLQITAPNVSRNLLMDRSTQRP